MPGLRCPPSACPYTTTRTGRCSPTASSTTPPAPVPREHRFRPLILDSKRCLPFHAVLTEEQAANHDQFNRRTRHLGQANRELGETHGENENRVTGEYQPGSEIDDSDDLFMCRFLYAFWRLCEQRIAVPEHAPVNHSAQVLADRAGTSPDERIVRLRRAEQPAGPRIIGTTRRRRPCWRKSGRLGWRYRRDRP